jgi:hypothetical protein
VHGAPRSFETIIGDAIHNMRSALDLMAVELVRINGGNDKGVCFPFSRDAAGIETAIKEAKFHRASSIARDLVRKLKPYGGGNDVLRALHDLDLDDKHRKIPPHTTRMTVPAITTEKDASGKVIGFPNDLRLTLDKSKPPPFISTFPRDGPLAGQRVVPTLRNMLALVTSIIDDFGATCPTT